MKHKETDYEASRGLDKVHATIYIQRKDADSMEPAPYWASQRLTFVREAELHVNGYLLIYFYRCTFVFG